MAVDFFVAFNYSGVLIDSLCSGGQECELNKEWKIQ